MSAGATGGRRPVPAAHPPTHPVSAVRRFVRAVLVVLDVLLLLFFGIGYLARYVPPTVTWWPQLVAIALPYLAVLLGVALVALALARRWRWVALHLVAVVLALVRFVPMERGAEASGEDLVVLTLNTSRGGPRARADELGRAITALVRSADPDLVGFQEAYIEYHPDDVQPGGQDVRPEELLAALVDTLGYRTVGPRPAPGATYTPQPVLARVELIEQTQTFLDLPEGEPAARVVRTHFRWQEREAVHYNLHLYSFGSRKPWEDERRNSLSPRVWFSYLRQYRHAFLMRAREIEQVRAMLAAETLPVLVSGDFNSTPHNWGFYTLSLALQDAFKKGGKGWGATYHRAFPLARIDHVLAGPEWRIVEARVLDAPFSDHLPLLVRLRWRE